LAYQYASSTQSCCGVGCHLPKTYPEERSDGTNSTPPQKLTPEQRPEALAEHERHLLDDAGRPPCWPESRPSCWSMSENSKAPEPVADGASSRGFRPPSGQRGPLERLSEAAESAPDCFLRRPHRGLCPTLGSRERAVLGDEHPKSRDRLRDSGSGHVGQWNRLTVEYAGWVRIVGT